MSKTLNEIKLLDILPPALAADEQFKIAAEAIQQELDNVTAAIPFIELYARINELPEGILMMLAWENNVLNTEWQLAISIEDKRNLVKNSFILNKRRGTGWAIERVFELLRMNATIIEWFEEDAEPGTFRIVVDAGTRGVEYEEIVLLNRLVDMYKPLTRHSTGIEVGLQTPTVKVNVAAAFTFVGVLESGL